jgi:hypothetical protein
MAWINLFDKKYLSVSMDIGKEPIREIVVRKQELLNKFQEK